MSERIVSMTVQRSTNYPEWDNVQNKPENIVSAEYPESRTAGQFLKATSDGFECGTIASSDLPSHTHTESDVTGLVADLNGKVNTANYQPVTKTSDMTQAVGKGDDGRLWTVPSGGAVSAVSSVNGQTGAVVLSASDVGVNTANWATAYSASSTYAVGDYVIYSGNLYRCTTAITTAEAWTAGHWTAVNVGGEIEDVKSAIADEYTAPTLPSYSAYDSTATYALGARCIYSGSAYICTTAITTAEAWTASHWAVIPLINVGEYRYHNNLLYRCTTVITTAEAWTAKHWTQVALGAELKADEDNLETTQNELHDLQKREVNLLANTTWTEGYLNGGTPMPSLTDYEYSDYIPFDSGKYNYLLTGTVVSLNYVIIGFDANKNYLSGLRRTAFVDDTTGKGIIYKGSNIATALTAYGLEDYKYVRINCLKANVNSGAATFCKCDSNGVAATIGNSILGKIDEKTSFWYDKKANFLGDSITKGTAEGGIVDTPFCMVVKDILGLNTVNNYGVNGTSISGTSSTSPAQSFTNRYADMTDDADLVVVCGGTNDYGTNVALGTIADTTDISFYGALNVLCSGLQQKYIGKQVVFVTPIHRGNETANSAGYTLADYRGAIVNVASRYGIPVIDGFAMGLSTLNTTVRTAYYGTTDFVHPNQAGHNVYGRNLAHALNAV